LLFAIGRLDNFRLKELFLQAVCGGVRATEMSSWNRIFLNWFLRSQIRQDGLETLRTHRQAGDTLILLTASPDCYVSELGRELGFDEVICTRVEWQEGRLSGKLASANMRGVEKVKALQDIKSRYNDRPITAYADHYSDLAMLRLADRGILVNSPSRSDQHVEENRLQRVVWRN